MARKISMAFLATIVVAALIQSSSAQTTHTVGGTLGWDIPQGGPTIYSTWAATQNFSVGDVLVFNFANNQHDVTEVNKADYDACTATNSISRVTTSPASITINGTGEHYFICGILGHCAAGQKLMINVTAATSAPPSQPPSPSAPAPQPSSVPAPAPQAATPTPVSAPSPAPVSSSPDTAPSPATTPAGVSYTVGDNQGWTITTNTAQFYQTWASDKTFLPGDILVFNYSNGAHDVTEVSKADFDSCNTGSPIAVNRAPPTRITLTAGEHYYICSITGHCAAGQKLAVSVGASTPGGAPSPQSPTTPSPAGSTSPPPPDSSARSLGVAGLSATFLSAVVVLMF
ncbi:uclacyanin 1-like [Euphorbia lathyris]|uniref:uclacyanin 1-like n=1 Tax=Euphorbia lathyris TaxID=212925 RepID=UPI0033133235